MIVQIIKLSCHKQAQRFWMIWLLINSTIVRKVKLSCAPFRHSETFSQKSICYAFTFSLGAIEKTTTRYGDKNELFIHIALKCRRSFIKIRQRRFPCVLVSSIPDQLFGQFSCYSSEVLIKKHKTISKQYPHEVLIEKYKRMCILLRRPAAVTFQYSCL